MHKAGRADDRQAQTAVAAGDFDQTRQILVFVAGLGGRHRPGHFLRAGGRFHRRREAYGACALEYADDHAVAVTAQGGKLLGEDLDQSIGGQ